MAIKVSFPTNVKAVTIPPLTQWDYGQKLEIEIVGLSGIIEVHFSHRDAKVAIVRTCSVINGIATVEIPDICLEQSTPVDAWVYEIIDGGGATKRTITIPINARTRPEVCEYIPPDFDNKYDEALSAMNELVTEFDAGMSAAMSGINSASNAAIANINTVAQGAVESVRSEGERVVENFSNFFPAPSALASRKLESTGYYYVRVNVMLDWIFTVDFGLIYWQGTAFERICASTQRDDPFVLTVDAAGNISVNTYRNGVTSPVTVSSMSVAKIGG